MKILKNIKKLLPQQRWKRNLLIIFLIIGGLSTHYIITHSRKIKFSIQDSIFQYKADALYADYLKTHTDPCDDFVEAYHIAKDYLMKDYKSNYPTRYPINYSRFADMKRKYHQHVLGYDQTTRPWYVRRYRLPSRWGTYHLISPCTYQFHDRADTSSYDNLGGFLFTITMQHDGENWRAIKYDGVDVKNRKKN